jgi:hypothetical protein
VSVWQRYARFLDRHEGAESLALVRIGVALSVLWDLLQIAHLDLVRTFWAPIEEGGLGPSSYSEPLVRFYVWFGASAAGAWWLFGLSIASACTLGVGLCTRLSALVLVLCSTQLSGLAPSADRGVDVLLRNVLCVLALSGAGAAWSLDAQLRRRRRERQALVPAWPRYLLIVQLIIIYFWAGLLKQTDEWSFAGGFDALYRILRDPHISRYSWNAAELDWLYPCLQVSTFATLQFERSALALPVLLWLHNHPGRGGALGRFVRRWPVLELWVATGASFHLALAVLVKLGIFPWVCLALYPALARPAQWRAWLATITGRTLDTSLRPATR